MVKKYFCADFVKRVIDVIITVRLNDTPQEGVNFRFPKIPVLRCCTDLSRFLTLKNIKVDKKKKHS